MRKQMQTWKRWGLWLFLTTGMACAVEGIGIVSTECLLQEDGTACNAGQGICQRSICKLECLDEQDGITCNGGQGLCQGTQCVLKCADKADGTVCDDGKGVCLETRCEPIKKECEGQEDGTACGGGKGTCKGQVCDVPPPNECEGKPNDTECDEGQGTCKGEECVSKCAGKADGTVCGKWRVCKENACEDVQLQEFRCKKTTPDCDKYAAEGRTTCIRADETKATLGHCVVFGTDENDPCALGFDSDSCEGSLMCRESGSGSGEGICIYIGTAENSRCTLGRVSCNGELLCRERENGSDEGVCIYFGAVAGSQCTLNRTDSCANSLNCVDDGHGVGYCQV